MRIQTTSTREIHSSHWIVFIFLIIITTILYVDYHAYWYSLSKEAIIPYLQREFIIYVPSENNRYRWVKYISLIGSEKAYIWVLIFLYCYVNIYKTFFMISVLSFTQLIWSILKLLLLSPRPYWDDLGSGDKTMTSQTKVPIIAYDLQGGFAAPSAHVMSATVFYLILWKMIFQSKTARNYNLIKYVLFVFFLGLILGTGFIRMLSGAHTLDQVCLGWIWGWLFYFFCFHVKHFNCNNSNQLFKLFQRKAIKYWVYVLLAVLWYLIWYLTRTYQVSLSSQLEKYNNNMDIISIIPASKKLIHESLVFFTMSFTYIGAILGLNFEFSYTFNRDKKNWEQYNFEKNEYDIEENTLLHVKITVNNEIQWNHSSLLKGIFRLILILVLLLVSSVGYILIPWDSQICLVLIVKLFWTLNLITFNIFYGYKIILKWWKVTNLTFFTILRESI